MKKLSIILIFFLTSFTLSAQSEISGTVSSGDDASVLSGVIVLEKGTSNETITDNDGKYKLSIAENATLIFSFLGYVSQEIAVNNQPAIDIMLYIHQINIDEVIIIGYGVTKKSLLTGSISSVKAEDLESISSTRADQAIQGRTAGVSI